MLLNLTQIDEASTFIQKAEKHALKEEDKQALRTFKSKIGGIKGKEAEFSKKIFSNGSQLYEDKTSTAPAAPPTILEELNK